MRRDRFGDSVDEELLASDATPEPATDKVTRQEAISEIRAVLADAVQRHRDDDTDRAGAT